MTLLLLLMVVAAAEARLPYSVPRVNMIQRRSCYYTPFTKELTCRCTDTETNTFLKLRLMFFIKEKGQEVGRYTCRLSTDRDGRQSYAEALLLLLRLWESH